MLNKCFSQSNAFFNSRYCIWISEFPHLQTIQVVHRASAIIPISVKIQLLSCHWQPEMTFLRGGKKNSFRKKSSIASRLVFSLVANFSHWQMLTEIYILWKVSVKRFYKCSDESMHNPVRKIFNLVTQPFHSLWLIHQ